MLVGKRATRGRTAALCLGLVVATVATLGSPAYAGQPAKNPSHQRLLPESSDACPGDQFYVESSVNQSYHMPVGIQFKSGPGGTVHATIQFSLSVTYTIGGSGTFSASALIADAKVSLDVHLAATASLSQSYTYDHNISAGKYGHLQFGDWGYHFNWKFERQNSNCTVSVLGSGSASLPDVTVWGYRYWETST